jgi:hypothetical protein
MASWTAMKLAAQKADRERRRVERRQLGVLLQWVAVHAVRERAGRPVTPELVADREAAVAALLAGMARAGRLVHFGIRDVEDLGDPPVQLYPVLDPRHPIGTMALDLPPLVEWISSGAMRGRGWRAPGELTADDL